VNNKASPPSTNPTKECRALFPYFPSLEGRLAGEHTVVDIPYLRTDSATFMCTSIVAVQKAALLKWIEMISFMSGNMDDFCVEKFHVIFERDLNVVT
jgi:hypothetical protein